MIPFGDEMRSRGKLCDVEAQYNAVQECLMGLGEFLGVNKSEEDHLDTHKYLVSDFRDVKISLFRCHFTCTPLYLLRPI